MFLLALGASGRITRFVTSDYLAEGFRNLVRRIFGEKSKAYYLVNCPWCAGIYVCGAVYTLGYFYGDRPWFIWPAMALSASWIIGLVTLNLDDE